MTRETIERAAIRHADGRVFDVPRPGRHHDVIAAMREQGVPYACADEERHEQGFVTSAGRFVGRWQAKRIAQHAGQLLPRAMNLPDLYSEDVW